MDLVPPPTWKWGNGWIKEKIQREEFELERRKRRKEQTTSVRLEGISLIDRIKVRLSCVTLKKEAVCVFILRKISSVSESNGVEESECVVCS